MPQNDRMTNSNLETMARTLREHGVTATVECLGGNIYGVTAEGCDTPLVLITASEEGPEGTYDVGFDDDVNRLIGAGLPADDAMSRVLDWAQG